MMLFFFFFFDKDLKIVENMFWFSIFLSVNTFLHCVKNTENIIYNFKY